jgi:hypothetical protein
VRLLVGTFLVDVLGWPSALSPSDSPVPEFIIADSSREPDFILRLSVGGAVRSATRCSVVLGVEVDAARRHVNMRLTEGDARFLLPEREVRAEMEGPWWILLESLLKTAVQLFALETGNALLLHASCLERNGKAYVFMGRSGAGKTTVAMLSRHTGAARLLREELTFVGGFHAPEPLVVATLPIREKHGASAGPGAYPLEAVYWLEQADEDVVIPLRAAQAFPRVSSAISIGVRDRIMMMPGLDLAEQLTERVPVKTLRFRRSARFWDAIDADLSRDDRR